MKSHEDENGDYEDEVLKSDDEENQGRGTFSDSAEDDDSTGSPSDLSLRDPLGSFDTDAALWPQSYRQSMDMFSRCTPPSLSFLRGSSLNSITSSAFSVVYKRPRQAREDDSSLGQPLFSSFEEGNNRPPSPSSSARKFSAIELPSLQEKCSAIQATFNGINVLCGIGILAVPYAIHQGGWSSLVLLFLVSIIAGYTAILLKRCLDSSPGLTTYPDIGQAAFGVYGRVAISIALYLDLYASCVEYIIMMSDNTASLFPNVEASISIFHLSSHQIFAIIITLVLLPTVWLRNLSLLSYLSVGGVAASILIMLCLFWVGTVDQVGFHATGTPINLMNLPYTIGIFGFCYSGHSVFPEIYTSMKEPSKFPLLVIVSFGFCLLMYAGTAVCGFLMFGSSIKSQFTLNMPTKFVASKIATWTTVVNPLTKYALTMTPVSFSLEELLPPSKRKSYFIAIFIRTCLTLSTLIVALTIPFFGFVMALMGSLLAMLVALIFPCACYLKLHRGPLSKLEIAACSFTILLGIFSSIIGTYSAITNLAEGKV
ncbi:hypothetical protein SAY87_026720 [Trapa incisa]|uniref:Amino acid transporter transmembrane domain-containing protein n=1 Tax=Trapa incisa TaxID=236973 RepID=A0AAN7JED3_9MYRT|nr:hypothetical protein SAY87_026720 [Trapa incisa]